MTPKEKAEELVSKMLKEVGYDTDLALPCALIAVMEVLNVTYIDVQDEYFWKQVKQEVEKLKIK
jgi:hypothetical protein